MFLQTETRVMLCYVNLKAVMVANLFGLKAVDMLMFEPVKCGY